MLFLNDLPLVRLKDLRNLKCTATQYNYHHYLWQGGFVFGSVCLFVCLFLCLSVSNFTRKLMNGFR